MARSIRVVSKRSVQGLRRSIQADDLVAVGETVEGEIGADLPTGAGDEESHQKEPRN